MPITIAHPAAMLPFRSFCRRGGDFEALFWGCMAPDLGHVIEPLNHYHQFTHSPLGLFAYCLPVGIVCFLLWRFCLAQPILDLIPMWWRSTLRQIVEVPMTSWACLRVPAFLLLGSLTHLIWDFFTHDADFIPYRFLAQVISSVVGLLILGIWLWMKRSPVVLGQAIWAPQQLRIICGLVVLSLLICAIGYQDIIPQSLHRYEIKSRIWNFFLWAIPAFHGALSIYIMAWYAGLRNVLRS